MGFPVGNATVTPFEPTMNHTSAEHRPLREYTTYGLIDDVLQASERANAVYIGAKNAANQTKEFKTVIGVQRFTTNRQYYVPNLSWAPLASEIQGKQSPPERRDATAPTTLDVARKLQVS
jgi:hypothetical protein